MPVTAIIAAGQLALAAASGARFHEFVDVRAGALLAIASGGTAGVDELNAFGNDLDASVHLARMIAGRGQTGTLLVDGLPSLVAPAGRRGTRVAVDANPFAVDRAGGSAVVTDVVTTTPPRRFSVSAGGLASAVVARAGLTREAPAEQSLDLSTGVRGVPIVAAVRLSRTSLDSQRSLAGREDLAPSRSTRSEGSAAIFYRTPQPSPRLEASVSMGRALERWVNPHAGGIVSAEDDQSLTMRAQEERARIALRGSGALYTAIVAHQHSAVDLSAHTEGRAALHIGGALIGGSDVSAMSSARSAWFGRVTAASRDRSWLLGLDAAHIAAIEQREPNPLGRWHFGSSAAHAAWLEGGATALHVRVLATPRTSASVRDAAIFGERTWRGTTAGIRLSHSSPGGVMIAPRVMWRGRVDGFAFHAGAGLFTDASSPEILLPVEEGGSLVQAVSNGAGAGLNHVSVRAKRTPDFRPSRSVMTRAGVSWHTPHASVFVDHSWTRIWNRPSYDRSLDANVIVDTLHVRNQAVMSATTARLLLHRKAWQLVLNGQHQRARDDGAVGAYESGVWARSAGITPLSLSAIASARLSNALSLTAAATTRSSAPVDILAGTGPDALGLFLDRGGRARNDGRGPSYASIDISLQVRVRLVRLSLVAANVLDRRNASALGTTAGSPTFGMPINYLPGRSVSISARLAR